MPPPFLPIGFLVTLLFPLFKSLKLILFISFFTSLLFETVQLIFVLGVFDVDDLILNSLGGAFGYLTLSAFFRIKKGRRETG